MLLQLRSPFFMNGKQIMARRQKSDRHRGEPKEELLFGLHPVQEALRAGRRKLRELQLTDPDHPRFAEIVAAAEKAHVPVRRRTQEQLTSLTAGAVHQGVILRCSPFPYVDLDGVLEGPLPLVVVADTVEDPRNLGAIARTALCLGATGLIIPKDRAATPTAAAIKTSAGALEHLPVAMVTNIARTIGELKAAGLWVVGLDAGGDAIFEANLSGPVALVIGGEDKGIRPLVRKGCDAIVAIPQSGPVNSLNASVAASMALYEIRRTRLA